MEEFVNDKNYGSMIDSRIIREGMKKIFSLSEDIEVVCEAGNGYEVLEQLASHIIDIVLLDIEMPIMDGVKNSKINKRAISTNKDNNTYYI